MVNEIEQTVHQVNELAKEGVLSIEFEHFDAVYGFTYRGFDDKYLVLINDESSKESQLKTLLHEVRHICSHFGSEAERKKHEHDAENFSDECLENMDIVYDLVI